MSYDLALALIITTFFAIFLFFYLWRVQTRRRLEARLTQMAFPTSWRSILERIALFRALSALERATIERGILRFIHTCSFEGVGLHVSDEMRVTVAFYAAVLSLGRPERLEYPRHVILYAEGFVYEEVIDEGGIVSRGFAELDGQAYEESIALSWHEARDEAFGSSEHNVIIHELAHIIDEAEDLDEALLDCFEQLSDKVAPTGHLPDDCRVLGEYAFENDAEFFAVASERFIQTPARLKRDLGKLYDALVLFYGFDPLTWGCEAPFEASSAIINAQGVSHG
ncbi:MAG: zinc-dependent peptidase [Campylobacterales bacterium]|nr:zinc-dependent peptidase [Campylobacterales bacterium]